MGELERQCVWLIDPATVQVGEDAGGLRLAKMFEQRTDASAAGEKNSSVIVVTVKDRVPKSGERRRRARSLCFRARWFRLSPALQSL